MSSSLWPYGLQHTSPPCPSIPPGVWPNSHPLFTHYYNEINVLFFGFKHIKNSFLNVSVKSSIGSWSSLMCFRDWRSSLHIQAPLILIIPLGPQMSDHSQQWWNHRVNPGRRQPLAASHPRKSLKHHDLYSAWSTVAFSGTC